jgi:hypothetical protein
MLFDAYDGSQKEEPTLRSTFFLNFLAVKKKGREKKFEKSLASGMLSV